MRRAETSTSLVHSVSVLYPFKFSSPHRSSRWWPPSSRSSLHPHAAVGRGECGCRLLREDGGHQRDERCGEENLKGYKTLTLWTNDVLVSARRIQAAEFQLVKEERHHSFGK